MTKVIFVHGNGGSTAYSHWFAETAEALRKLGLEVINETFPDNQLARSEYWLPHLEKLGANESTIIVGHSSGALAAMRYAESHQVLGSVLVGAAYTDLGEADEKASGYFDSPWDWNAIKAHQKWILQFGSVDDPYIPIAESRFVAARLSTQYFEYKDRGHFMYGGVFEEVVTGIKKKLNIV
jgi:predicted alpha/beta hydrolase family esterase